MRHYSPYSHGGGGKSLFAILLGIVVGVACGYFGDIYITGSFGYFAYKSMMIGAVAGAVTALIVSAISSSSHRYY